MFAAEEDIADDASLSGTWGGAPASTTVVVGAPLIHYRQGGADICIVFSTALISAVAQGPLMAAVSCRPGRGRQCDACGG